MVAVVCACGPACHGIFHQLSLTLTFSGSISSKNSIL